jgi:hypothetical protein
MAIALRSARFIAEGASLEVRECADRTQIQIVAENDPPMASDRYLLTLSASDWARLINLPYVDRSDCERHEQPPVNVLETFTLVEDRTSLEVRERPDRESLLIIVRDIDDGAEDGTSIELTAEQWQYLRGLDYVGNEPPPGFSPIVARPSQSTVH